MRAAACALAAALLVAACGKAADPAPESAARPTDDEVRAALKEHFYANVPKGVVQKTQPDFTAIKVVGCAKSAKEGFECDFVNLAGVTIKDRFVKGARGWETVERVGG